MNKTFKKLQKNKSFLKTLSEQERLAFNEACKRSYQLDTLFKRVKVLMKKEDTFLKKNYKLKPLIRQVVGKKTDEVDVNKILEQWQNQITKTFQAKGINPKSINIKWAKILSELELDAECYYLIALRFLDLLERIKVFNNIKDSSPCKPIILVANGLIKHSEKKNMGGTMELSLEVNHKTGPKIKGAAIGKDDSRRIFDPGLYISHKSLETKISNLVAEKIFKQT
jgi:hypothetical protein